MALLFLGGGPLGSAQAPSGLATILLHPRSTASALPAATSQKLKVDDFRKLVTSAVEDAGFTLNSHHYLVDGVIWKRRPRSPDVQQHAANP